MRGEKSSRKQDRRRFTSRLLRLEPFEERTLFAIAPHLVALIPNEGALIVPNQVLHIAPRELTFRFDDGQTIDPTTLAGIQITRGGKDHVLGTADDVTVTTGFVGIGESSNEVVLRFDQTLPNDVYKIKISGTGATPLKNTAGLAFKDTRTGGDLVETFTLDLGAQVVSVVPQPVTRSGSALVQASNQIDVYFNDNALDPASANNTAFYELIRTGGTLTNADDTIINPTSASYDATTFKTTLQFAAGQLTTPGLYRLRIGNNDPLPLAPTTIDVSAADPGSTYATAKDLGNLGASAQGLQSTIVTGAQIGDDTPYNLAFPGDNADPSHRHIPIAGENYIGDGPGGGNIPELDYNFHKDLGTVFGNPVFNLITEAQKQRAREIFSLYSKYLGVQFVETASSGITVATSDLRIVDPTLPPGPDGPAGVGGGGMAVMNNSLDFGKSEFGGSWFSIAMHEIGHVLGYAHADDAPPLTVMNGGTEAGTPGTGPAPEPVYPGDIDILNGQHIIRPDVKDIDLYKFTLTKDGTVDLETIAQRSANSSLLDSVISVFDGQHNLIARNDNYYGKDSFLHLQLVAGTYFVGITSTGNTQYDPNVVDSGIGGTSSGLYDLRINVTPNATGGLVNTNGTPIDGDADGKPGGTYNFWFQTADATHTIFVDKTSTSTTGALGSITHPYTTIAAALNLNVDPANPTRLVANPGTIVRIEGNGGTDGNLATAADATPYDIGFDNLNNPLPDGSKMEVPKGVTVMIDAGAVIKLRGTNIDVGTSAQGIDRSGGALQVLGTPTQNVYFTSFNDTTIGSKDATPNRGPLKNGDFGGLVFRDDSDYEAAGIFLNYVNHAQISHGGGQVTVNSVTQVYDPVHMIRARPTVSFNTITSSSDAAMSGDPNSFEDSEFQAAGFTADYGRIGPDVHGNTVTGNSINGLFVRIQTLANQNLDTLSVPARFNDTDIVYVISENLIIQGGAGGSIIAPDPNNPAVTRLQPRMVGRLAIDPGVVVKLDGARIEAQIGSSQIIAEGTANNRVIFTSLLDDKYGAGGAFDTTGDGSASAGAQGNWGGIYFGPATSGSIDHALITYAGGSTTIEGGFDRFNAVEIHQANVRVANSTLENNAGGGGGDRNGRSTSTSSTIFVRGAQPVLVNNIIRNNAGPAISINVNSLNSNLLQDTGRSTGVIDLAGNFLTNTGPLVNGNRLDANGINGMVVRGGELTTQVIFDDTDIAHVVQDEIIVGNQHSIFGLRLQSSPTQSLVVKLKGATAGFTAAGRPLDISDRIGGTVQVLGMAGHPVVLTSLSDDSVGAGVKPNGTPQNDTNGDGSATTPQPGDWRSVKFAEFSNDRNVAVLNEAEAGVATGLDVNNLPTTAQFLGNLAADQKSGDDNQRLGFEIHGAISRPSDVDVYSFKGVTGSEVWFDISRSTQALDTVLELVDANGQVLGSSNDSTAEATDPTLLGGNALPLSRGDFGNPDYYTQNPRDAGMRMVLPGNAGQTNTYYIRVRSNSPDLTNLSAGQSTGVYQLQVRLQQLDEFPGSTVRYADMRYATNGVEVLGKPEHSPLIGETGDSASAHNTFATAQDVGNLLTSDRATIGVAGSLASSTQVNWYKFQLQYDLIQRIGSLGSADRTWATMFDMDYADGAARPDTTMSVYDENGNLLLVSRDSNIADDQARPGQGADLTDLSRGSMGQLDSYIGSVQMPVGAHTYYVAVSSNTQLPTVLDANFKAAATDPLVRLEPINSINKIVEDRIGSVGGTTAGAANAIFSGTTPTALNSHATAFTLGDVVLFVNSDNKLYTVNPANGGIVTTVGGTPGKFGDVAMRNDGKLYGYTLGNTDANSGNYVQIDTGAAGSLSTSNDGIATYQIDQKMPLLANGQPNIIAQNIGVQFNAVGFDQAAGTTRHLYAVGNRADGFQVDRTHNLLFELDPNTGLVLNDPNQPRLGTDAVERASLSTGPTIIAAPATNIPPNKLADIVDGQSFAVTSGATTKTFEFDSGPEIKLDAKGGAKMRDGMKFVLNGNIFEFDSGPLLDVNGPGSLFVDGETFSVTDNKGATQVFEFDSDSPTKISPGNKAVAFGPATSQANMTAAIVSAINSSGLNVTATAIGNRIQLTGDTQLTESSAGLTIEGGYGVTPGDIAVPFEETDTAATLGTEIAAAVNGAALGINSGSARDRVTFYGATTFDFTLSPPITYVALTATGVTPGRIAVPFTAGDSAITIANEITAAINSQTGSGGFNATAKAFGGSVELTRASGLDVSGTPALASVGAGPGGDVTGMVGLNGTMYAVSSLGGLYTLNNPGGAASLSFIASSSKDLDGIQFSGLTAGPPSVENGKYANLLFATDTGGKLYAFNTSGKLQAIFGGATSVDTGVAGAAGLAFSTLDYNLWHVTLNRKDDPGHGINPSFDHDAERSKGVSGGQSYYFGLEQPGGLSVQPGSANYASNPGVYHTYDLPGGALGSLTSDTFDLTNYAAQDKPTLYFNYFLNTAGVDSATAMQDSFRVFISNDGTTWSQVATNNSAAKAELPAFASASGGTYRGEAANQNLQEMYDNTGGWRQARIDLGDFAGKGSLRLRFDFSTAGTFNQGLPGDKFGDFHSATRGQNNGFEGAYIDDIMVGFAERGEMVTGVTSGTAMFTVPQDPNPAATKQSLVGAYQLEIRRGTEYAVNVSKMKSDIVLTQSFDTNDRLNNSITIQTASGANTTDGDTLTLYDGVNKVTFEFDNNSKITKAGAVPVTFSSGQDASGIAADLAFAINNSGTNLKIIAGDAVGSRVDLFGATQATSTAASAKAPPPTVPLTESGDTLASSTDSTLSSASPGTFVATGTIGDSAAADPSTDVDFVSFQLDAGQRAQIDVDALGFFDPWLRVFDSKGVELAFNDDGPEQGDNGGLNSFLNFTAPVTGKYYLGVSGYKYSDYDPNKAGSGTGTFNSTGDYKLEISIGADTSSLQVLEFHNLGDSNTPRDQGYTLIEANRISNALAFGIVADADTRTVGGQFAHPGSPRNTRNLNTSRLVPGISLENNLIVSSGQGGIKFVGDGGGISFSTPAGSTLADAQTFSVVNGAKTVIFEFDNNGATTKGNDVVTFTGTETSDEVATLIANAINADPTVGATANASGSSVVLSQGSITGLGAASGVAAPPASIVFGRIVNNTIYGGATPTGTGVLVSTNASPTILNNVFSNLNVGVQVDASSNTTVLGANLYQGNTQNSSGAGADTFGITLAASDPLFVDAAGGDFYLKSGSKAIDSALDSLQERTALATVISPLGIPVSPILAPLTDLLGQQRVDDPSVQPPPGLGNSVFKDRGALDRADFVGPTATIINPPDNNAADQDPALNHVKIAGLSLSNFQVQFADVNGSGVNDSTITAAHFTLTLNGTPLILGNDYLFSYDATNKVARFDAAAGIFTPGTYVITADNTAIMDLAANTLKPNDVSGSTSFQIVLGNSSAPWQNPGNRLDVNGNGAVSTIDAILIINKLHANQTTLPAPPAVPPPYYDVNGNGRIDTGDAILVINFLKSQAAAQVMGASGSSAAGDPTPVAPSSTAINTAAPSSTATTSTAPAGSTQVAQAFALATDAAMSKFTTPTGSAGTVSFAPVSSPAVGKTTSPSAAAQTSSSGGTTAQQATDAWDYTHSELDSVLTDIAQEVQLAKRRKLVGV